MSVADSLVKVSITGRNEVRVAPGHGQTLCSFVALELRGVTVGWKTMPMMLSQMAGMSGPGKIPSMSQSITEVIGHG